MLNLNSIMVGSTNVKAMIKFYKAVFQRDPDMSDGGYNGWSVGSCFFTVGEHSEMKGPSKEGTRVMFVFETTEVKQEYERIMKIEGAKEIAKPSKENEEAFNKAIAEMSESTKHLLSALVTNAAKKNREVEAQKREARSIKRFR